MLLEGLVDVCLVAATVGVWALNRAITSASLLNVICCLRRTVEATSYRVRPSDGLWIVARVDLFLGQLVQGHKLFLDLRQQVGEWLLQTPCSQP